MAYKPQDGTPRQTKVHQTCLTESESAWIHGYAKAKFNGKASVCIRALLNAQRAAIERASVA